MHTSCVTVIPLWGHLLKTECNVGKWKQFLKQILMRRYKHFPYYVASSVNRQDGSNPVLWLATRVGMMELSCLLKTTCCVLHEKLLCKPYNKSLIDQACLLKMAGYIGVVLLLASLWTSTLSLSINMQNKNLANIQSSWPDNRSITHIYCSRAVMCAVNCVAVEPAQKKCLRLYTHLGNINYPCTV